MKLLCLHSIPVKVSVYSGSEMWLHISLTGTEISHEVIL
jgi:hypothetical protein